MRWYYHADDATVASGARREFFALLAREQVLEDDRSVAEIAFGELLANVVRHAPGPVTIAFRHVGDDGELTVSDAGDGYDLESVLADDDSESKRGLFLTKALVSSLTVTNLKPGSCVVATFPMRRKPFEFQRIFKFLDTFVPHSSKELAFQKESTRR